MFRRTKIVATLGPATDNYEVLEDLLASGVNVVRLNFSHGSHEDHKKRVETVREIAKKLNIRVGILSDLQGPKIRIAQFKEGQVQLIRGEPFILDSRLDEDGGTQERVGIVYKELVNDVKPQDILLLDDGLIILEVTKVTGSEVHTKVVVGGKLSDRKGVNLKGGGLSARALTDKDREDLACAVDYNTDFVAISFPKNAEDIFEARELLKKFNSNAHIIAKIERAEALDNIDEIIKASDGIMIARGDLAVEIGNAQLVGVQKKFIRRARQLKKTVITATQMMESMTENPTPTRAEVMDVANAILDGTDAIMLSAESAAGKYPVETVREMVEICYGAESELVDTESDFSFFAQSPHEKLQFSRIDEAIALSSIYIANHLEISGVACLTETGTTAMIMSRMITNLPIFGMTRNQEACGHLTLCRGVIPIEFPYIEDNESMMVAQMLDHLKGLGYVKAGERVIITLGALNYETGGTNTLRIEKVP